MRPTHLLTFLLAAFASSCADVRARPAAPEPVHLTLVATNDLHGWVFPHEFELADGTPAYEGGLATFAGYVDILRRQNPGGVLLLDGGDLFQGTLPSNLTEGAAVIDGMNHLGYLAAALGNHEFDFGPVGPAPVALKPQEDPFGALKARIAQAKFPILAANVLEAKTGRRPAWLGNDGTMLVTVNGVKVGLVGLITPTTPSMTNPVNVASLRFEPTAPAALAAAKSLRARGAEVVIALAHVGGKCARWDDPTDLSSCDRRSGEIFELLEPLPPGTLDAVIAAHTHAPMGHFIQGTPVVETPGMGRRFGVIDLYVDPVQRKVLREQSRITPLLPICAKLDEELLDCDAKKLKKKADVKLVPATFRGEPVKEDGALAQLLAPARALAQELQHRPLGVTAPVALTRKYEDESPLGLAISDALRAHENADLAILNPGGLRSDLRAGELRYGDVFEVIPFDNTIATLTVSGDELARLLAVAYGARYGVFQVSGAKVELSRCPGPDRLKGFSLDSGQPPRADRKYRVVMPDFLARGGDGLAPALASLPPGAIDLGEARSDNFRDAIVAHWIAQKTAVVAPKGGRVTFVDDGSACGDAAKLDLHAR